MIPRFALIGALALAACAPRVDVGRAAYAEHCAGCHGVTGQGDGTVAGLVPGGVPDLTGLSERAGGNFPRAAVIASVDRISLKHERIVAMPDFGTLLEGPRVGYYVPRGEWTKTSATVVAIADYLETLQR